MKSKHTIAGLLLPGLALVGACGSPARAQVPVAPIVIADTAVPMVVNAIKPKPSGLTKFEGFVLHANRAQITVRAKGNDMAIETFTLSEDASLRMQRVIDKGGYQYGDKVTVLYDPTSFRAVKVKGKPSRPL
jgi:hypothetical protein